MLPGGHTPVLVCSPSNTVRFVALYWTNRSQRIQVNTSLATCFNVKGRGLVVITSCSHRGVVNTVRRAMEVSRIKKVHAVAGGFHLAPQKEDYVRQTVTAPKETDPDYVIPMH